MSDNFDSLAYPNEQAEALASAMFRLIDRQLVSKGYLDQRLGEFKAQIVQWMFGVMILQSGVTAVLVKLLH